MRPHLILAHSGGLGEVLIYLLLFLSPSILMGVFAGLPKFLFLYFKKPKEVAFDNNMFFGILAGEIVILNIIFFASYPGTGLAGVYRELSLVSFMDSLSAYSLSLALMCLKIFLINALLLEFLLNVLSYGLPAYGLVAFFLHRAFRPYFSTRIRYILYCLSFPLLMCLWILVAPLILENHKEYFHTPFTTDNELNMMLYHAVREGLPNVVKGLVLKGADVNFEYWKGRKHHSWETPLTVSFRSKRNSVATAAVLIENGADINAKHGGHTFSKEFSKEGDTPYLVYLVRWRDPKRNDPKLNKLIDLLIESGADVEAKDQFGKTYLDYLQERK